MNDRILINILPKTLKIFISNSRENVFGIEGLVLAAWGRFYTQYWWEKRSVDHYELTLNEQKMEYFTTFHVNFFSSFWSTIWMLLLLYQSQCCLFFPILNNLMISRSPTSLVTQKLRHRKVAPRAMCGAVCPILMLYVLS